MRSAQSCAEPAIDPHIVYPRTPAALRAWLELMDWSAEQAARAMEISGKRFRDRLHGKTPITARFSLACYALFDIHYEE